MFTWKELEALNAVLSQNGKTDAQVEALRSLSVKMGMLLVSLKNEKNPKPPTPADIMKDFPFRVRRLRERRDLTQDELAKKLNLSRNAIFLWEKGENKPALDTFIALCTVLETSPDYLLGWSDTGRIREAMEQAHKVLSEGD